MSYDILFQNSIKSRPRICDGTCQYKLLYSYWQVGKLIADSERTSGLNEATSRSLVLALSQTLTKELGRGFSRSNLFNMRNFYLNYPAVQTLSGQLSWSHYSELLAISDKDARNFYEQEDTPRSDLERCYSLLIPSVNHAIL